MTAGEDLDGAWIRSALDRYERPLFLYARRLLGDEERARDAVQEAFLRLCRQEPRAVTGRLSGWLFATCRNSALDVRRKESRMHPITEHQADTQHSRDPVPDESAETRDTAGRILGLVEGLPEKQREVVRLKFQHGMSYREIAGVLDLSVTNVGFLVHTALKSLRQSAGATH
jgi:RNA polymerase sigma-70 factor (ECF subfamily)